MNKLRILIDCDGVLASFTDHVRHEVNEIMGTKFTHDDLTEWELYDALDVPTEIRKRVDAIICSPGFCIGLQAIDGARLAVDALRAAGHQVLCLTTPFDSDHWHAERVKWLRRNMGFKRKEVTFSGTKEMCHADVLVDDKVENLQAWEAEGQKLGLRRTGILFTQPWNERDERWKGLRASSWWQAVHHINQNLGSES